jgi:hypothetical protein
MTDNQPGWNNMKSPSKWPEHLEPLRPDDMTQYRIRKRVMASAERLKNKRIGTWFDVTARWSVMLAPVAAGLLVVFGILAYRTAAPTSEERIVLDPTPASVDLLPSLAPDAEQLPMLLIDTAEPSRNAVLAAALITP